MDENKIVKIPISYEQRKINEHGNGYVPCQVSSRWLQFNTLITYKDYIMVNVMTETENNSMRKICELVLSKEDLLRAINSIETLEHGKD
ncbi:hypothetical protein [Paenisporosarcina sp. NPDC076898]|uniref:hypothetical protein n=1 Tax=unclassified Paenisporosarcina TaxID=2642018 RepID=UPI003D07D5D8